MSDEVSDQNASDAGGLEPPAAPAEAIWQRLLFWFYLDRGMLPLVYRLCGLAFVPSCIWLYFASHQPLYTVPTWRIGQSFLWLPALPEALDRIIMVGAILSAIMLVAGFKQRLFVIIAIKEGRIKVPYRRTNRLGQSITTAVNTVGGRVVGTIGTNVDYAPWVISSEKTPDSGGPQAQYHKKRWWTLQGVVADAWPHVLDIYQKRLKELINS